MENVFVNNAITGPIGIVETCLSVYPELGVLHPPAWLEKHPHICLVETAAYLTALGVDGDAGRAKIRHFLQADLGPKLEDARAQMAVNQKDQTFREWAEPKLAELKAKLLPGMDRKMERAIHNQIDQESRRLRKEFDNQETRV